MMNAIKEIPEMPDLGGNLRKERRRRQLSLAELSSASGISKAMLSQIETDKVNPTIATLWKISHALDVELETLISGGGKTKKKFEVMRKEVLPALEPEHDGAEFTVLSPASLAEDLEFYRVRLKAGCRHCSQAHTEGTEELLCVEAGTVRVEAGGQTTELRAGDALMYESDVTHTLSACGATGAELYMTVRFRKNRRGES